MTSYAKLFIVRPGGERILVAEVRVESKETAVVEIE